MESMVVNSNFWRGKDVLITGHTGFKGSWLSLWLQKLGANVIGLSLNPPSDPNLFTVANVAKEMTNLHGNICDLDRVQEIVDQYKPEVIFHMAAQSLVRHSYENPIETYATNVMGTVNLLEVARHAPTVKVFINVTSDKCYENNKKNDWLWGFRENDQLGGLDPYSNSKACAELVTSSFRNSYYNNDEPHCAVATVRAGNVIGGGDWAKDRLVPDIIRGLITEKEVIIRNPESQRPWQHVLEPLQGYLQLAEKAYYNPKEWAQAWNFGPNDLDFKTVGWIVAKIFTLWETKSMWQIDKQQQPQESFQLKLDSTKAKAKLGWQSKWNLEQTLRETVDWYRAFSRNQNMREMTLAQIDKYTN